MNKPQAAERFKKVFGEEPTGSKTDQFFMEYLDGLIDREKEKINRRYKKATIREVVSHYSKTF